jgi:hypothetical protein
MSGVIASPNIWARDVLCPAIEPAVCSANSISRTDSPSNSPATVSASRVRPSSTGVGSTSETVGATAGQTISAKAKAAISLTRAGSDISPKPGRSDIIAAQRVKTAKAA